MMDMDSSYSSNPFEEDEVNGSRNMDDNDDTSIFERKSVSNACSPSPRNSNACPDMEENYFITSMNEDYSSLTTIEDLEKAILQVKENVLRTDSISNERKTHVKNLISLRLKLQDLREVAEELSVSVSSPAGSILRRRSREHNSTNGEDLLSTEEFRLHRMHQFLLEHKPIQTLISTMTTLYCDRCTGVIWYFIQNWYKCKTCKYKVHSKCLNQVVRECPTSRISVSTEYEKEICPEVGLHMQQYRCKECKVHFTLKNAFLEPRRCDYNGNYFCPLCHHNRSFSIPARILQNWDFDERKVCEESFQFLSLMSKKPNLNLEKINVKLFGFVQELALVKKMREDIIMMKEYFLTCREASSQRLLRLLEERQHFIDNSYMYTLQDLIDINNEQLLKFLEKVHSTFTQHIKVDCQTCKGKAFICEICSSSEEMLFPFDSSVKQCSSCMNIFHISCYSKRGSCPKCLRISRRFSSISTNE